MVAHYFETVENTVTGKPVANASVSVLTAPSADGGTELTIYSDEGLTTPVDNPLTTDSTGYFEFYTDQDECCLEVSYGGTTRRVIENVQLIGGSVSGDITSLLVRMDAAEAITQDVMVVSLASLTDPDADRIVFWDDSAGGLAFLTVGTGLSLSGTTLAADLTVSSQSGTSYTAALADANTYIRFTNGSAVSFTIPPNSDVAFPIGTVIEMEQAGAGALSVVAGSGVTINSRASDLTLAGQYAVAFIKKVATNTWTMNGDL